MALLQNELDNDKDREKYEKNITHLPRLFSTDKVQGSARRSFVKGLSTLSREHPQSGIVKLQADTINSLIKEIQ